MATAMVRLPDRLCAEGRAGFRQYADVIVEYGYQPTFFIHLKAELQADLFNEMLSVVQQ